jgi:hypothetical protein
MTGDRKEHQELIDRALALDGRIETHLKHVFKTADDLWSPLQVLSGRLESFDTTNFTEEQKAEFETILENTRVLIEKVRELLRKEEKLREDFQKLFFVR